MLVTVIVFTVCTLEAITVLPCKTVTVTVLEPGVNPDPEMPTVPNPLMPCGAARVILGVPRIVSDTVAVLPDASVTAIERAPGVVPAGMITALDAGMLPFESVAILVVFAVDTVLNHDAVTPPKAIVTTELPANPAPLIGTTAGALTAVNRFTFSVVLRVMFALTVKDAVAAAVPAETVTV